MFQADRRPAHRTGRMYYRGRMQKILLRSRECGNMPNFHGKEYGGRYGREYACAIIAPRRNGGARFLQKYDAGRYRTWWRIPWSISWSISNAADAGRAVYSWAISDASARRAGRCLSITVCKYDRAATSASNQFSFRR